MEVLGRQNNSDHLDARGKCDRVFERAIEPGLFVGEVTAAVWKSRDLDDRDGIVIQLETAPHAGGFVPHAVNTPSGVQLHMAGREEAATAIDALISALQASKALVSRYVTE